ncbi:hypothetical protein HD554DRAFT_2056736 [Boletus coccyginus]|nr:hypothetical protein HD554DRAFT_2056736 [Boletus coccyginus]
MPWELSSPQREPSPKQLQIDRKILQDPSSFLEAEARTLPLGLTPSTRLPSADGRSNTRPRVRQIDLSQEPRLERHEQPPGSSADISPRTKSRLNISRISKIAVSGEWPTFGRKREHRDPVVGVSGGTSPPDNPKNTLHSPPPAKDNKHLSTDSIASVFSLSRLTHPASSSAHEKHSSPGTRSRQSLDIRFSSKPSSPSNTMSSKRHPRTPQGPSSHSTPVAAHATSSVTDFTTPVNQELAADSPHTFGHPTPPDNPVNYSLAPAPPPLPPLDHPELAGVLSSRRHSASAGQLAFRDRSNALPTNRGTPRKDDLFASLSFKLGRPPQVMQVFNTAMGEQNENRPPDGPHRRRRARTISAGTRQRRTSADWSSYQASVGVNSHANQAWPAEVSREIVRLSLRGSPGPDTVPGSSEIPKPRTRGGRTADPDRRPNQDSTVLPSFLPFPHPSRPNSPPPFRASATFADGQEVIPHRPHSLQFDLGNRRRGEQPARFSMAEIRRSLSAIESRNGRNNEETSGANYTSLGLGDPAKTLALPPQASPLFYPSFALTPSRSLLSGRILPTDNPMASSVQGEPSTPTPAPRHLSDKSRGKRKAEDNIDLTPPEQKKEGQRATFLLPSETRSQRVSNSLHAPSSYHRKRARLTSTSPFATPTPRSANRSHRFTSLSSSTGAHTNPSRTPSRAASTHSQSTNDAKSMSAVSIPISAIVSPHAPSISRSTKFHMRDPRKPPKKSNDTPWGLRFATEDEPGSPIQAWCFFFGFLLFLVWWIAGLFLRVPKTRIAGDIDPEKGVAIDDPQIEHDAKIWRFRCRVMAAVSLFTYVPFIVLVTIFAPR